MATIVAIPFFWCARTGHAPAAKIGSTDQPAHVLPTNNWPGAARTTPGATATRRAHSPRNSWSASARRVESRSRSRRCGLSSCFDMKSDGTRIIRSPEALNPSFQPVPPRAPRQLTLLLPLPFVLCPQILIVNARRRLHPLRARSEITNAVGVIACCRASASSFRPRARLRAQRLASCAAH